MAMILLVDRDPATRELLRVSFEHRGHAVLEATSGEEGLRILEEERADVVIGPFPMDVPGHSPFIAAARKRGGDDMVIVSFSGRALPDQVSAAEAVADAALTKPAVPNRVVEEVERLLGERDAR